MRHNKGGHIRRAGPDRGRTGTEWNQRTIHVQEQHKAVSAVRPHGRETDVRWRDTSVAWALPKDLVDGQRWLCTVSGCDQRIHLP